MTLNHRPALIPLLKRLARLVLLPVLAAIGWRIAAAASDFDTPSVWIGESRGILAVAADTGAIRFELPMQIDNRAIAFDSVRNRIWAYSVGSLLAYDRVGAPSLSLSIDSPQGQPAKLRVERASGVVWLGLQTEVRAIDPTGRPLFRYGLPQAFAGITLDSRRNRLWVGARGTLTALDVSGTAVASVDFGKRKLVALDYAEELDQVWAVLDDSSLTRINPDGSSGSAVVRNDALKTVRYAAADGVRGVWVADDTMLRRFSADGTLALTTRPFAGDTPEQIADLGANAATQTLWIASTRKLLQLRGDGSVLTRANLDLGDNKTRALADLSVPPSGPRVDFLAPVENAFVNNSRPGFELQISGGSGFDHLAFQLDGSAVTSSCSGTAVRQGCTLSNALTDGAREVQAQAFDTAGRVSVPALLHLTIDTVAPTLIVTAPADGLLTNNPSLTLRGGVSEPGTLMINGVDAPLGVGNSFGFGPVTLNEGINRFQLRALDRAGNVGIAARTVTLDTIAPAPPLFSRLTSVLDGNGVATLNAGAGSVEVNALVTAYNPRTGQRLSGRAGVDGSFSMQISAQPGDSLELRATDAAGNTSGVTSLVVRALPGSEPIILAVTAPIDGLTMRADHVVVSGTLSGPANTGVQINGVSAALVGTGSGHQYFADIPLVAGANVLTVTATAPDGRSQSHSLSVTRTGNPDYRVRLLPSSGIAPLPMSAEVADGNRLGISRISIDLDGDGIADASTQDSTQALRFSYAVGVGLRQPLLIVYDSAGRPHMQTLTIVLLDPAALDTTLRATWGDFTRLLAAGDIENALLRMAPDSRSTYRAYFGALAPHLGEIVGGFSDIQSLQRSSGLASYALLTSLHGQPRTFVVQFVQAADGVWRIASL